MRAWLESIAGPEYASALMWTVFALIGLLVLLILIRIVRGLTFGTFVAGGRNRKARLAVMDATAVDSHRRLVLIRRDDVEHLILIGGPTDVVVEQNIRLVTSTKRATVDEGSAAPVQSLPTEQPVAARPAAVQPPTRRPSPPPIPPASSERPAPPPPSPAPQPPSPAPRAPAAEPRFSTMPPVTVAPAQSAKPAPPPPPVAAAPSAPAMAAPYSPATVAAAAAKEPPPAQSSLDDALLKELEVSLEREPKVPVPSSGHAPTRTLDDEMNRLLDNLSVKR